jgi:hypothetical protein
VLSNRVRSLAGILALSVTVTQFVAPSPAHAAETDPGPTDRTRVVAAWQTGGPQVRVAAEQALLGSDADVHTFLSTKWAPLQAIDQRIAVDNVLATGGAGSQSAAQQALDSTNPSALTDFLTTGWQTSVPVDERIRINQMMASGGAQLRAAGQKALDDGSQDALEAFLNTGWSAPNATDQRIQVVQILAAGGPEVKASAQRALDSGDVNQLTQFIDSGWAVAAARDEETATLTDLVNAATQAGNEAAAQTKTAQDEAGKANKAAAAAKAAAARAAQAMDDAHGDAKAAAAAAREAADAANNAAAAAKQATTAAAAASHSARVAANAAARAASAAAATSRAAAKAQSAAASAALDANAAQNARDMAKQARDYARAAQSASVAADHAGAAASDAKVAGQQAIAAAGQAQTAAQQSLTAVQTAHAAGVATTQAVSAAQQAAAQAARAVRAANAATAYAAAASAAAFKARDAVNRAIADANKAADAADDAAAHAGEAAGAAARAANAAQAATDAANAAITAATTAQDVFDTARQDDAQRIAVASEEGEQQAQIASAQWIAQKDQIRFAAQEASKRTAQVNTLIAAVDNPATPDATAVADARQVALALSASDGEWTRAAALNALGSSDVDVVDYVRTGVSLAAAQDDRVTVEALAANGSDAMYKAATAALAGSDAQVSLFLQNQDYPGRATEDRVAVVKILAAAQQSKGLVTQQQAQAALDNGSSAALHAFLDTGQYDAAAADDRVRTDRILADPDSGPELKARAQVALDSPPGAQHDFLNTGQYTARRDDLDAATHDAQMVALLDQARSIATTATQNAQLAQASAAKARGDATAAADWARQAGQSATTAAGYANDAKASANSADASAARAAASARSAADAADAAQRSARSAANSALDAQRSFDWAQDSARGAYQSAQAARASALAAGKSAQEANQFYHQAMQAFADKANNELKSINGALYEACAQETYPLPPSPDCLGELNKTPQQRLDEGYTNASFCGRVYPQGSDHFKECLSHAFSPNFGTFETLNFADDLLDVMNVYTNFNLMLMVGAACGGVCAAGFLAFTPELLFGAGIYDMLVGFGLAEIFDTGAGFVGIDRIEALIESESVEDTATFNRVQLAMYFIDNHLGKECGPGLGLCDELWERLLEVRAGGTVKVGRNLAGADVRSPDFPDILISASGDAERKGFIPLVGSVDNPKIFEPTSTGNNGRGADSEYKLLNYLANKFKDTPKIKLDIILYTERFPCTSCQNVVDQFRAMFPNINLYVLAN